MAFGSVLSEQLDSPEDRKARGAFFTPPELADAISAFAIATAHDRVLEPSCGEGEFIASAAKRLHSLGASTRDIDGCIQGNELHAATAEAATARLHAMGIGPTISVGDFFDMNPDALRVDAVIGNPPYIRYQDFSGRERAKAQEAAMAAGVRLDSLASSWAPFVVHASRFLDEGGRLGFVLPAELLAANYAAPVREFLLRHFRRVDVVLFEKPVFPEVQEEVVLLCAGGYGAPSNGCIYVSQVDSASGLGSLKPFPAFVEGGGRWPVGKASQDAQQILERLSPVDAVNLSGYGRIRLGAVTGANSYFVMTAARAASLELGEGDLVDICPPGSRHLRTLALDADDLRRLDAAGKPAKLFCPQQDPSPAAKRYIAWGEETGIHKAYKCRIRKPWWRVPGLRSCDIFITYMNGAGPNLCYNRTGAYYLNSVHGLILDEAVPEEAGWLLPIAAMSSLTLLSAELFGRSYGGGILKLEPSEAGKMLVPSPEFLVRHAAALESLRGDLEGCLASGNRDKATLMVDEAILPDLGMSYSDMQRAHGLLLELRARRARRGKHKDD